MPARVRTVTDIVADPAEQKKAAKVKKADANTKLLLKHNESLERERALQCDNRIQRSIDEDFEDNDQWSAEDKAELEERGQAALVFNEIKPTIEWLLGTEKRSRADWKIVPRCQDDVKPAQRKTKLFKYVSDINSAEFQRSLAFGDAVRSGDGWIKVGVKRDENGAFQIEYKHCSWREFWVDSRARAFDLSDARYLHRVRYTDVDDVISMHPGFKEAIESAARASGGISDDADGVLESEFSDKGSFLFQHSDRPLVRLRETWYRTPQRVKVIRGEGPLNGEEYVATPELDAQIDAGGYEIVGTIRNKVRCSLWIDNTMLFDGPSPYKHGLFPYVRVLAYRKKRDGTVYGVIRAQRDPQEDLNKRMSKAQFALSVRRTVYEKNAVEDPELLAEEVARPDSMIELNNGFIEKFKILENGELARGQLDLAVRDSAYIRTAGGVTGENLGLETNATSGKAINARQEQGAVVTTTLFDNLRQAMLISGRMVLSLIEQFMTEKMVFRITGERGKDEFVSINDGDADNDITRFAADFIVEEQDWSASTRQAMSEELIRVAGTLPPEYAILVLDVAFELSDLANKDEIVKRLRKAGNLPNPDATDDELEQEKAKEASQQQMAQAQAQMDMAAQQAKVDKDAAQAALAQAKAVREGVMSLREKLETLAGAVSTAATVSQNPAIARAADELLAQVDSLVSPAPQVPDQSQSGTVQPSQPQVAGA